MNAVDIKVDHLNTKGALPSSPRTRVLIIINHLALGGGTKVALDLATYLHMHPNYEVHLIAGQTAAGSVDVSQLAYERGIPTRVIMSLVNHIDPVASLKAFIAIRQIIAEGNYDIVHTHTKVAGIVGRLAARAAKARVIIHHVHGWGSPKEMGVGKRMMYLWLERLCARFTSRIITVCKLDMQKGLANRIAGEDKFAVIYNGIELEKFRQHVDEQQLRSKLGLDSAGKLVGMIGRLDKQKNPLDFIRAAAIVAKTDPKVQFVIVGDGPLRPQCERLISELRLNERFFLLGYRNDVAELLPIFTLTAMSSLWEGLPFAFLESMSAGKPIVANNVDGAREVVMDGETGFLVTPHRPTEMAERILFLLNHEAILTKMGHLAQQRSNDFSMQRMLEKVMCLYEELLLVSPSTH